MTRAPVSCSPDSLLTWSGTTTQRRRNVAKTPNKIEAYDAIQRRYGIDTDTMIHHLQAVLANEIAWAEEQKREEEEAEPHGWMPCGCDRGCESCGGGS